MKNRLITLNFHEKWMRDNDFIVSKTDLNEAMGQFGQKRFGRLYNIQHRQITGALEKSH